MSTEVNLSLTEDEEEAFIEKELTDQEKLVIIMLAIAYVSLIQL